MVAGGGLGIMPWAVFTKPLPTGTGPHDHRVYIEVGDCPGHTEHVDNRIYMGELVEVHRVGGHAVHLRFGVDDDVEDGPPRPP